MEAQPKISVVEIVFITPLFVLTDAIGVVLGLMGMDDIFILDIVRTIPSQTYLWLKGVRGTHMLIANLAEAVPYLGALPLATVGWLATVWIDRKPEGVAAKAVQKTAKVAPIGKDGSAILRPTNLEGIKKSA